MCNIIIERGVGGGVDMRTSKDLKCMYRFSDLISTFIAIVKNEHYKYTEQ